MSQFSGLDISFRSTNRRGLSIQILMVWLEICATVRSVEMTTHTLICVLRIVIGT